MGATATLVVVVAPAGCVMAGVTVLFFWLAYVYVPEIRVFVHSVVMVLRDLLRSGASVG